MSKDFLEQDLTLGLTAATELTIDLEIVVLEAELEELDVLITMELLGKTDELCELTMSLELDIEFIDEVVITILLSVIGAWAILFCLKLFGTKIEDEIVELELKLDELTLEVTLEVIDWEFELTEDDELDVALL
jgi:hypothetical protein